MTWSLGTFIVFLTVNFILTVIYLIVAIYFRKVRRQLAYLHAVPMLLAPGVGILFFMLSWFGYEFIFRKDVDLSDVVFSKERMNELVRTNENIERNMVPLEEAIEISDNSELRGLVMGVAQGDYSKSLASIALALNCDDSETAHYAASVLQDALNDFRLRVSTDFNKVKTREDGYLELAVELIRYMDKVLIQNVFTPMEQKSFAGVMADTAEIVYLESAEDLSSDIYESVALRLLEVEDYDRSAIWADRSMIRYPYALSSYTSRLKLYFNSGQREKFFDTLNELKASQIIIDKETLELIRTFS